MDQGGSCFTVLLSVSAIHHVISDSEQEIYFLNISGYNNLTMV